MCGAQTDVCLHSCLLCEDLASDEVCEKEITRECSREKHLQCSAYKLSGGSAVQGRRPEKNPNVQEIPWRSHLSVILLVRKGKRSYLRVGKGWTPSRLGFWWERSPVKSQPAQGSRPNLGGTPEEEKSLEGVSCCFCACLPGSHYWEPEAIKTNSITPSSCKEYLCFKRFVTIFVIFPPSKLSLSEVDRESRKTARASSRVCSEQRSAPRSSTEEARWRLISSSS